MSRSPTLSVEPDQQSGSLLALREVRIAPTAAVPYGRRAVLCRCDCGTETVVKLADFCRGIAVSCGCRKRRTMILRNRTASPNVTHGLGKHWLYQTWHKMLDRCENPDAKDYARYGARGIRVCARWHDVALFVEDIERDLGDRPAGWTLDRIDNDGNYEPGNVRWASAATQAANRRRPLAKAGA